MLPFKYLIYMIIIYLRGFFQERLGPDTYIENMRQNALQASRINLEIDVIN